MKTSLRILVAAASLGLSAVSLADWSNLSGNARQNSLAAVTGPDAATATWTRSDMPCLIAWSPITEGHRMFTVRQTYAWAPYEPPAADARVHCLDIRTGVTLWTFDCPFEPGDWSTVVYGARDGRVYVGRGGNGAASAARVHCLSAQTGAVLWVSNDEVRTAANEGIAFMDDGDPIFASHNEIRRIDAMTGATVWYSTRTCSVSGHCGPARDGDAIYIDETAPSGQRISRFSAVTGLRQYSSQTMPGFLNQNSPFCAPGGFVFYLRSSNEGPTIDLFYAFRDTGSGFELLWTAPTRYEPFARHGVTPDGGVTLLSPLGHLQIRDQQTGVLRAESASPVLAAHGFTSSLVAVDSRGRVFHNNSNGAGDVIGDLRAFSPTLSEEWRVSVMGMNQSPALAADGSLLVTGTDVLHRYWSAPCANADLDCDGAVNGRDLGILLGAWGPCAGSPCAGDINRDGTVNGSDLGVLLGAWG